MTRKTLPRAASGRAPRRKLAHGRESRSAAEHLAVSEALFRDFQELTPYPYRPFTKSFDSWDDYERWRRAQTNPWYR